MSQYDPYNLDATFMRDDQSRHAPQIQREATFSLAGNAPYHSPLRRPRTASFVTAEYELLNPNYNQPETTPIWGLAKPFPRVVRRGMRPRALATVATQHAYVDPTSHLPDPISRHDGRPQIFPAQTWAPRRSSNLLRDQSGIIPGRYRTQTDSRYVHRPEVIPEGHSKEQTKDGEDNRTDQSSSHDVHEPEAANNLLQMASTHQPSAHDFALEPSDHFEGDHSALARFKSSLSNNDQFTIDAARQRLQEQADTASRDSALRTPAYIDWDEFNQPETQSTQRPSKHYADEAQEKAAEQAERHYHNQWARYRHMLRQPLAEFLGTFVVMVIGLSASLTRTLAPNNYGNFLTSDLSWGIGVMIGIYTSGGISGAHLNPAISIMLAIFRGFPWHHCYRYIIAQFLGAIAAAGVVYGLYRDGILHAQGGQLSRSGSGVAFYTQPQDWVSNTTAFFNEFVAGALLSGVVLALGDDSNAPPGAGMQAFIVGLFVAGLSMTFSYNSGAALNPARDFGPRLVTLMAGYGGNVFTDRQCWWVWGTWVAPVTGGLVGAFVYDALVFTGGESPVNYPKGAWKEKVEVVGEKAGGVLRDGKGGRNDEEKVGEDNG